MICAFLNNREMNDSLGIWFLLDARFVECYFFLAMKLEENPHGELQMSSWPERFKAAQKNQQNILQKKLRNLSRLQPQLFCCFFVTCQFCPLSYASARAWLQTLYCCFFRPRDLEVEDCGGCSVPLPLLKAWERTLVVTDHDIDLLADEIVNDSLSAFSVFYVS